MLSTSHGRSDASGRVAGWLAALLIAGPGLAAEPLPAQDAADVDRLSHLQTVTRDDLGAVCNVNFSPDGAHLYAAAWQAAAVSTWERDPPTGRLTHRQSIANERDLNGVTTVRLSPDGRYALAAAFRARAVVLFERDPLSGKLTMLDVVRGAEQPRLGLVWPIDAEFSPDGRFVYVCDPKQSGASNNRGQQGSIFVFEVTRLGQLALVEVSRGENNCFFGCRGVAFHPDGKTAFAACTNSSQVVVLDRDPETGRIGVRQIVRDDHEANALEGVIGIACSPDGRFVYASSGRFSGDNAVTVFRFQEDRRLSVVQEVVNDVGPLRGFIGGNEIAVSPDGRFVYATATRSGALARFRRDAGTGRLTHLETLSDEAFIGELGGAADAAVSPDGRFVYVAAETGKSITALATDSSRTPGTTTAAQPSN